MLVVVFVVEERLETVRVESESVTEAMSSGPPDVVVVVFDACGVSEDDVLVRVACSVEAAVVVLVVPVGAGEGEGERERVLEYGSMLIMLLIFFFFFRCWVWGLRKGAVVEGG